MIWLGSDLRLLLLRAEPQSARGAMGLAPHPRPRLLHGHLGALGQRLLHPHRRARIRQTLGGFLSALPGAGRGTRPRLLRALRPRGHRRSRSPPALGAFALLYQRRRGAPRPRRRLAHGAVPRRSSRRRCSCRRCTASRSTSCSSLAAFVTAERGRFGAAGLLTGLAILTRATGLALLPALALLAWRARDRRARALPGSRSRCRSRRSIRWCSGSRSATLGLLERAGPVAPPSLARRPVRRDLGGLSPAGVDSTSRRRTSQHDVSARSEHAEPEVESRSSSFVLLTVVAWRRFGAPYGLFAAVSLVIPLSYPARAGRFCRCRDSGS